MKERKFAIDIDGVLLDTVPLVVKMYNTDHNTNYQYEDLRNWEFWKDLGCEGDVCWRLFDRITNNGLWEKVEETDPYARIVIERLRKIGKGDLVTARTAESLIPVKNHLESLGYKWDGIVKVDTKDYSAKAIFAKEYEFFVDDGPFNARSISEAGGLVYLYATPLTLDDPYEPRVENWRDVEKRVFEGN